MLIVKNTPTSGTLYAACIVVPAGPNGQWPGINGRNYPQTSIEIAPGQTWSEGTLVATHFYVYLYNQQNPAGGTVQPFWHGRLHEFVHDEEARVLVRAVKAF